MPAIPSVALRRQLPLAAAMGLAMSVSVHATTVLPPSDSVYFSWGATAENGETQTFSYLTSGDTSPVFSTGGLQVAEAGNVRATVNATVDPYRGVFKSITTAQTGDASRPASIAESYMRADLTDTIRISGPEATTTVTFRMSYDSQFSGLGLEPFPLSDLASHFLQADSSRRVALSYELPNPAFDPGAECTGSGETFQCGIETQQFLTQGDSAGNVLFREWAQSDRGFIYSNGDVNNGRYTGEVLLTMVVPTDVDLVLSYSVYNGARCFHLSNCNVAVDASHSDYIGLELDARYTFASAAGFAYQGLPTAVPEPASLSLMLAGLLGVVAVARRKAAA